jgi:small-conductance mechanosensitive channel
MTQEIAKKLEETKIDITFPEIEYAIKENDIEKIVPKNDLLDNKKPHEPRLI